MTIWSGKNSKWKHRVIATVVFVFIGIVFWGVVQHKLARQGHVVAPVPGQPVKNVREPVSSLLTELHGFVVWSSNRFGNHDIVMLSLPERRLTRLTTNSHIDYFPRISPDGSRILFCRSQRPRVSQRDQVAWDVFLLDLKTGREELVVKNGNVATWSATGRKMYFQRQGNQFVEYDFSAKRETVLFESGKNLPFPASVILETPVWSEQREELAVTLRGSRRATVIVDRKGRIRKVGKGCELNWGFDSSYLYHVDHGGKGGNTFYLVDALTLKRRAWFDFPGAYSHEYFPKVANTGDFLVYGASTGGHEHDTADYEIFLWRIGSLPAEAVRLTYHTGNDCWPDVYLH